MCFSAQVSFAASGAISVIGFLTLRKVKKEKLYPLALIPLLFAIQQAFEGVVWIFNSHPPLALLNSIAIHGYLFFAFFIWPIWVPFALLHVESKAIRRNILFALLGLGFGVSTEMAWSIIQYGVTAEIVCHHVQYNINMPQTSLEWRDWAYGLATIIPFFVSSKKHALFLGLLICGAVAITWYFFSIYFLSVWCFLAAIISITIYKYIED